MQKIKDERLILKNLKNIRIAFAIQTLGIILILFNEFLKKGNDIIANPLWILFVLTMTVLAFLSINISVDYDRSNISSDKSLKIGISITLIISSLVTLFVYMTPGYNFFDGLIYGGILFICGFGALLYVYILKKKNE
ncbi:hypothetical protein KFV05_01790 [Macrococcoides canis]|uniref:hypothetical protein n=1 Tax=Macrococcoides canis TaxID=1855823 RepID=UPI0020B6D754|nr:hypothetical protein [Macrococcus canis]UTH02755.1 hypothetical protein KFV05_01790 [Macrococcus canis]